MRPTGEDELTSAEFTARARGWARSLEDREAASTGRSLVAARRSLARKIKIAPGTLENLRKGRIKAVAADVYARLHEAVDRQLYAEMRRLEHEYQLVQQQGLDPRSLDHQAILADMAKIKTAMGVKA